MPFDFSYNGTPYYLETTKTYNIAITNTGTPSEGIVYKISDTSPNTNLPLGLVLNSSTGTISGTTTFASITTLTNYIIDASAETQIDASANIGILVDYSPEFIYPGSPYILTINKPYIGTTQIKPNYTFSNKVGITYTVISTPPLTDIGLNINSANGNISGTPTIASNLISYTIRANNSNIIYDTVIQISVEVPPIISYPKTEYLLTQNQTISIVPENIVGGNTNPIYTVNCKLPSGLTINSTTGEISGIPTILTTTYEYTIRVSDIIGDAYTKLILSVIKEFLAPPFFTTDGVSYEDAITNPAIQMRRKAEILQHKQNSSKLTKQQYLSLLAKGNGPYSKRAWATQGDAFTSSNTSGLPQSGSTIVCNSQNRLIYKPTSSSNVPGPVVNLFLDPNVQPNGYIAPNRKRVDIGFKWPFSSGN